MSNTTFSFFDGFLARIKVLILGMVYDILLYQHYMDFRKRKWVSLNMIYMAGSPNIVFVNLAELHFPWRIGRTLFVKRIVF